MSALDPWVLDIAAALGVPATDITADLRAGLLDLTREVEDLVGPSAGPMTGLVLGVAVGRGIAPSGAVDTLRSVLASHQDRHASTEPETIEPAPGADTTVPLARDTAPPLDTAPPEDTALPEDTAPSDTAPPENTAPEGTAPSEDAAR